MKYFIIGYPLINPNSPIIWNNFFFKKGLSDKMEELEEALLETRDLVQMLRDEISPADEQSFVIDLVRLKENEVNELEEEVALKRRALEAATTRTNELAGKSLAVQFETDNSFIH